MAPGRGCEPAAAYLHSGEGLLPLTFAGRGTGEPLRRQVVARQLQFTGLDADSHNFEETPVAFRILPLARCSAAAGMLALGATLAFAHGDVTPQAVDTKGLKPLGEKWLEVNPYRGDKKAVQIGSSAYNQNCARCHGLEAVSGGIAPDLRYLPEGKEGDEIFVMRVRNGAVRDGRVYMPKYEGILSQEALWTIRAYLDTVQQK